MDLRRDSLVAAAEWISRVEREGRRGKDLVATVGTIEAKPGATNVIAGETRLTLDVRHRVDEVRKSATEDLIAGGKEIAARRGLRFNYRVISDLAAVAMDPHLTAQVEQAIRAIDIKSHRMTSGAGHDAMIVAEKVPAAMIFLRTPGGISHSPDETVLAGDVEHGIEAGLQLLRIIDSSIAQGFAQKGD
jgi:allantoate deiminase